MTLEHDITALRGRIVKAESDRNLWRAAGQEEKYLEAYFMVEALEIQLAEQLRQRASGSQSARPQGTEPGASEQTSSRRPVP